jgi:crossover junction endodeoxyribonuclease RusA
MIGAPRAGLLPGFTFVVRGTPVTQGSKDPFTFKDKNTGRIRAGVKESAGEALKSWRADIRQAALDALAVPDPGMGSYDERRVAAIALEVTFVIGRPAGHYGTGRNAGRLRPSAPEHPTTQPDLDKLVRAVKDALTSASVWRDDSQVVETLSRKVYPSPNYLPHPGAIIHVALLSAASQPQEMIT